MGSVEFVLFAHACAECLQVVVEFLANTTSITEYVPGQIYTVRSPAYARITNCWIHASDGVIQPFNASTHQTASTCLEAAFSLQPAAVHEFLWTSTEAGGCVEFTVAQALGASDAYNAAAVRAPSTAHFGDLCVNSQCAICAHSTMLCL